MEMKDILVFYHLRIYLYFSVDYKSAGQGYWSGKRIRPNQTYGPN